MRGVTIRNSKRLNRVSICKRTVTLINEYLLLVKIIKNIIITDINKSHYHDLRLLILVTLDSLSSSDPLRLRKISSPGFDVAHHRYFRYRYRNVRKTLHR